MPFWLDFFPRRGWSLSLYKLQRGVAPRYKLTAMMSEIWSDDLALLRRRAKYKFRLRLSSKTSVRAQR